MRESGRSQLVLRRDQGRGWERRRTARKTSIAVESCREKTAQVPSRACIEGVLKLNYQIIPLLKQKRTSKETKCQHSWQ